MDRLFRNRMGRLTAAAPQRARGNSKAERGAGPNVDSMHHPVKDDCATLVKMYRKDKAKGEGKEKKRQNALNSKKIHPVEATVSSRKGVLELIHDETDRLRMAVFNAQKELSIYAIPHIREGLSEQIPGAYADFYTGRESLAKFFEEERLTKVSKALDVPNTGARYSVSGGYVSNRKGEDGRFVLDTVADTCKFTQSFALHDGLIDLSDSARILSHKPNIQQNFRYTGLIFSEDFKQRCRTNYADRLSEYLSSEFASVLVPPASINERVPQITQTILDVLSNNTEFLFSRARVREFSTKNYKVFLCGISGQYEFTIDDKDCIVFVDRRTVFSCPILTSNADPKSTPLCEEIIVQLQYKASESVLLNTGRYLVLNAHLCRDDTASSSKIVYIHSVNAFDVIIPKSSDESKHKNILNTSRQREILVNVGFILRQLENVHSNDQEANKRAETFFQKLLPSGSDASNAFKQLIQENIQAKRPGDKNPIKNIELLQHSFIGNQNSSEFLSLSRFQDSNAKLLPFNTEVLYCRPTMAVVAFSPHGKENHKMVFCFSYNIVYNNGRSDSLYNSRKPVKRRDTRSEFNQTATEHPEHFLHTSLTNQFRSEYESSLPPELELELQLL